MECVEMVSLDKWSYLLLCDTPHINVRVFLEYPCPLPEFLSFLFLIILILSSFDLDFMTCLYFSCIQETTTFIHYNFGHCYRNKVMARYRHC